jgi:hypothetical protein
LFVEAQSFPPTPSGTWLSKEIFMSIVKVVNEIGITALKKWIETTALPDYCHTDQRNIEAWCQEAEESMGNGNPPIVEMRSSDTKSGVPETFTIPDAGISAREVDDE